MKKDYEYIDIKKVLKKLKTSLNGLTDREANRRLKEYGYNELPHEKKKSIFKVFIESFMDPIIYVMIVAAILSFIANEPLDALAIIFIILVDAVMSTIQEYRATKNAEALKDLIKVKTKVIRDNEYIEIDSSLLVPGDIIVLESGTKISADARIINSNNLTVDESILTGESIGVLKEEGESTLSDISKKNMLYAGTSVLTGRALAVVCGTGLDTEVGKIAEKVTTTEESKSPLTIRMEKFSKQITMLIVVISIIIAIVLIYKKYEPLEIFLSVVALGVSAMPEGLPLSLTLALTIASNKMSKRNVIVKKLNSVESLGSCTVIASDKTGTLTVNEQTAKKIVLPNGEKFDIEGNGYNDVGKVIPVGDSNIANARYIATLGVVNNESMLEKVKGKWDKFGDSIDIAFLALGRKLGIKSSEFKKVSDIPYESEKKYSAVFYKIDNDVLCTAKGSVEVILDFCKYSYEDGEKVKLNKEKILKQNEELASNGYRVIAICDGDVPLKEKYSEKDVKNLTFIGLVGFIDPVRKEAVGAIKKCKTAGIKVLMITGDHALTAYAIAKDLNIVSSKEEVVTGSDLDFYSDNDEKFDRFVEGKKVFARVTPIQKLKIVESLQRQGEFVAVTGDGVNDAPALKKSDVGFAMGSGTEVAKEASDIVILDDNFMSIVNAILFGRTIFKSIRKFIIFQLTVNICAVLISLIGPFIGINQPVTVIQMLWINMVMDTLAGLAFSYEAPLTEYMNEPPKKKNEHIINSYMFNEILIIGIYLSVLYILFLKVPFFKSFYRLGLNNEYLMTAFFTLFIFTTIFNSFNARTYRVNILSNILRNKVFILVIAFIVIIQLYLIYYGGTIFRTAGLTIYELLVTILISFSVIPIDFIRKILLKKLKFKTGV